MLRLSLILLALLVLPAQAHAAEGFLGVTEQGRLVGFTSQQPFALSTSGDPVDGWQKIRTDTGISGWVRASALGP